MKTFVAVFMLFAGNVCAYKRCHNGHYFNGLMCIHCSTKPSRDHNVFDYSVRCGAMCRRGFYGTVCSKSCSRYCINGYCDRWTGHCVYGCSSDMYGPTCNISCGINCTEGFCNNVVGCHRCAEGLYGRSCQYSCKNCIDSLRDMHGRCSQGCKTSWHGEKCDNICPSNCATGNCTNGVCDECKPGYRGPKCSLKCPVNCTSCHQYESSCMSCYTGSYGSLCDRVCVNCISGMCSSDGTCSNGCHANTYGTKCDKNCSRHCRLRNTNLFNSCSRESGHCMHGCSNGWSGPRCDKKCSGGCLKETCEVGPNDRMICNQGCRDGWWGPACNTRCPLKCRTCHNNTGICENCNGGTYGYDCSQTCSDKCVQQNCDTKGFCTQGCVSGWLGETCNFSTLWFLLPGIVASVLIMVVAGVCIFQRKCLKGSSNITEDGSCTDVTMLKEMEGHIYECKASPENYSDSLVRRLPVNPVYPCYEGDLCQSAVKNRYENILPYDYNRIVLVRDARRPAPDYINASYIKGYDQKESFIATQGPFYEVFGEFWQMVWQLDVSKIVMLTKCLEDNRKKCDQYWPNIGHTQMITPDIVVECQAEVKEDCFFIRTFIITKDKTARVIKHFHFTTWPDHNRPHKVAPLLKLLSAVTLSRVSTDGPVVVHCSAGVGRTGTYIALDYLIKQAKAEGVVDVFECVLRLRHQRMNMVQTEEQYMFIYEGVLQPIESLKRSGSIVMPSVKFDLEIEEVRDKVCGPFYKAS